MADKKFIQVNVLEHITTDGDNYAPGIRSIPESKVEGYVKKGLVQRIETEGSSTPTQSESQIILVLDQLAKPEETSLETLTRIITEGSKHQAENQQKTSNLHAANQEIRDLTSGIEEVVELLPEIEGFPRADETALNFLKRYVYRARAVADQTRADKDKAEAESNQSPVNELPNTMQATGEAIEQAGTSTEGFTTTLQQPIEISVANSGATTPVTVEELSKVTNIKAAIALRQAGYTTRESIASASDDDLNKVEHIGDGLIQKLREWVKAS